MKEKNLLVKIYQNPRYKGKHIIIIKDRVHVAKTGREASSVLAKLLKRYPKSTPTITYIPKADALILIL